MHHAAPQARASLACGLPELPAIVLTRAPLANASGVSRLSTPDGIFLAVEQENSAQAAQFPEFYFGSPHDFSSRFASPSRSVLRI
jgi:hypothetical protein